VLKKKIKAGVMMYALLMAAVFSLLLQFYLNRQTANQRNFMLLQERQTAYAIALLTQNDLTKDSGELSFNKGKSRYQKENGNLLVAVEVSGRTYDFNFSIKEKDKNAAKSQASEDEARRKKLKKKETSQEVRDDGKKD